MLIFHHQLEASIQFVKDLSNVKIVLDHLGKPDIAHSEYDHWSKHIFELSKYDHVYCKISGMVTEASKSDIQYERFVPYMEHALNCFGTERLMLGSDWPVCLLAANYHDTVSITNRYIAQLSHSEQEHITGKTAAQFYNL